LNSERSQRKKTEEFYSSERSSYESESDVKEKSPQTTRLREPDSSEMSSSESESNSEKQHSSSRSSSESRSDVKGKSCWTKKLRGLDSSEMSSSVSESDSQKFHLVRSNRAMDDLLNIVRTQKPTIARTEK
jgi:hypothetical protein